MEENKEYKYPLEWCEEFSKEFEIPDAYQFIKEAPYDSEPLGKITKEEFQSMLMYLTKLLGLTVYTDCHHIWGWDNIAEELGRTPKYLKRVALQYGLPIVKVGRIAYTTREKLRQWSDNVINKHAMWKKILEETNFNKNKHRIDEMQSLLNTLEEVGIDDELLKEIIQVRINELIRHDKQRHDDIKCQIGVSYLRHWQKIVKEEMYQKARARCIRANKIRWGKYRAEKEAKGEENE